MEQINHANNPLNKRQGEVTQFQVQKKRVFAALYRQPKTMLMVSIETGILRANICRYVAEFRKQNRIAVVKTALCQISNHQAGYLTTNPELFPLTVEPSNTGKL